MRDVLVVEDAIEEALGITVLEIPKWSKYFDIVSNCNDAELLELTEKIMINDVLKEKVKIQKLDVIKETDDSGNFILKVLMDVDPFYGKDLDEKKMLKVVLNSKGFDSLIDLPSYFFVEVDEAKLLDLIVTEDNRKFLCRDSIGKRVGDRFQNSIIKNILRPDTSIEDVKEHITSLILYNFVLKLKEELQETLPRFTRLESFLLNLDINLLEYIKEKDESKDSELDIKRLERISDFVCMIYSYKKHLEMKGIDMLKYMQYLLNELGCEFEIINSFENSKLGSLLKALDRR